MKRNTFIRSAWPQINRQISLARLCALWTSDSAGTSAIELEKQKANTSQSIIMGSLQTSVQTAFDFQRRQT
ncbi:hypothetical protein V3C99_019154 [Haemonchus contortus]